MFLSRGRGAEDQSIETLAGSSSGIFVASVAAHNHTPSQPVRGCQSTCTCYFWWLWSHSPILTAAHLPSTISTEHYD